MQDFPANSNKAKGAAADEPREKIQPVTSAEAVRRKRGLGQRFKETFVGGDARTAFHYMLGEVIIPAIQDTLIDAFQGGVERLIRGESSPRHRRVSSGSSGLGHVAYNRYAQPSTSRTSSPRTLSRRSRARHEFDELIIPSLSEANEVIDRMFDLLGRYGEVSVADLYELTGIQSSHTDMKWGWTELRGTRAQRLRQGGYLLDLPEPEPLN